MIQPASIVIIKANMTLIQVYIANGNQECTALTNCKVTLEPIGVPAFVLSSIYEKGIRILQLKAPPTPFGTKMLMIHGTVNLTSSLVFTPPDLLVEPVDSTCSGGKEITIWSTWRGHVLDNSEISVWFRDSQGTNVTILEMNPIQMSLKFTVLTPLMQTSGFIPGRVNLQKSCSSQPEVSSDICNIQFFFECFSPLLVQINPGHAYLDGSVDASGDKSVHIKATNFPSIRNERDVKLEFNGKLCDGSYCAVTGFQNTGSGALE
jgi:hypothetical protein